MTLHGAVIHEQGITFAIAVVKRSVLRSPKKEQIRESYVSVFGNMPIILMAQDFEGIPKYDGRRDIVAFLQKIRMNSIPWKQYSVEMEE